MQRERTALDHEGNTLHVFDRVAYLDDSGEGEFMAAVIEIADDGTVRLSGYGWVDPRERCRLDG